MGEAVLKLHYTPGSPFSRIIRVLLRELSIDCREVELMEFPPPAAFFKTNPLGQVPALETDDGTRFPTRLIIDHIISLPREKPSDIAAAISREPGRWQDEQILSVLLSMGDAIAALKYQRWAGLRAVGENLVGYDPAERHSERIVQTLDWLEARSTPKGFLPAVLSVQDITLACLLLWTDARGGLPWRGRANLEAIVSNCSGRPSFTATEPQIWP
jgi:glutathione S-transferase